ncbi:hypothetical protein A9Q97_03315, partial [Rhodospirillales bacterium 47_12_T64]
MVSHQPPEHAVSNLPVRAVSLMAFRTITGNMPALIQMAAFPLLLSALITALSIPALGSPVFSWLLSVLAYVPHTLFAVAWHRRTLLELKHPESTSITAWRRDHWQFLLKIIILLAIFYGMSFIGSLPALMIGVVMPAITPFLIFGVLIATLYVVARLSFVLPATAVGESYSLDNSWQHTKKQGWSLIGAILILTVPFIILLMIIAMVALGNFFSGIPTTPEEFKNFNSLAFIENNGPALFFLQLIILTLTYFPMAAVIS